jgi:histidine triad (HIT) family protein
MIRRMSADCIFCRIVNRSIPAALVYSDDHCVAFSDIHPQAPTHILVVPRRHVASLPELFADEGGKSLGGQLLAAATAVAGQAGLHESGFRVVVNTGDDGGQSVHHLHLHVLGKRQMGWPPG